MPEPARPRGKTDPNLRLLAETLGGALLWGATFLATRADWLAHATTLPARVALVAIGMGGFLPMVFVYAKAIRIQDEFSQRLHLIALGIAFAVIGVLSYGADMLHQAHFIEQPSSSFLWMVMVVVWWLCIVIVPRFYR